MSSLRLDFDVIALGMLQLRCGMMLLGGMMRAYLGRVARTFWTFCTIDGD